MELKKQYSVCDNCIKRDVCTHVNQLSEIEATVDKLIDRYPTTPVNIHVTCNSYFERETTR